jgi:tetratricopeptide (TPR) repeat protein
MTTAQTQLLLNKVKDLNENHLYSSASSMAGILVTSYFQSLLLRHESKVPSSSSHLINSVTNVSMFAHQLLTFSTMSIEEYLLFCSILFEYGIALRNTGELGRAELYIGQMIVILRHLNNIYSDSQKNTVQMKLYEALELIGLCSLETGNTQSAVSHFESIPQEYRSMQVHMKLSEIYEKKGSTQYAIKELHSILKVNPYALTVISRLIELSGSQVNELKQIYSNIDDNPFDKWINYFIDATYARKHHKYKIALNLYESMNQIFPNNPEIIASIAECRTRILDVVKAKELFEKCRYIDEYTTCEIASYALVLRRMNALNELQKLACSLLKNSKNSPETWATLCIYYEAKGQNDIALKFAQKSIDLNERYVMGYLLKANVLAMMSRFSDAVSCYHTVHYFSRDIRIYQGLVNCYMAIPQLKDAKSAADMALKLHPNHFKSAILLGNVLNVKAETRELARAQFQKAMQMCKKEDELYSQVGIEESLIGLAEVEARNNNFAKAINLLKEQLAKHNSDTLHMKLGELYMKSGNSTEAMHHYHTALSINPSNEQVKQAIEELELILQPEEEDAVMNGDEEAYQEEEDTINGR